MGNQANYTSQRILDEMLEIVDSIILKSTVSALQSSPTWAIMIDEATDIAVEQQLGMYAM